MKDYGECLTKISKNIPNDPAVAIIELVNLVRELIEENQQLRLENQQLRLENQQLKTEVLQLKTEIRQLKDEIAVLKNQPPRPKIAPSKLEKKVDEAGAKKDNWKKSSKNQILAIDRTEAIELSPDKIPNGAKFKGYKECIVQELVIKTETIRYRLAQWQKPDGGYVFAKLPIGLEGHQFGTELRKYIIHQYNFNRVPQNRILADLQDKGVSISAGQINFVLLKAAKELKAEKDDLLNAGLESGNIQADDTGARHQGKNGFATVICSDLITYFKSTDSKSRINFLEILCGNKIEYTVTNEALNYIKSYAPAELTMTKLHALLETGPIDRERWCAFLKEHLFGKTMRKILTEGALIGTLIAREIITPELILMSDGAGQFALFTHIRCWIHIERSIKKIIPVDEAGRLEQAAILDKFWAFYRNLKAFKETPTEEQKAILDSRFDEIFSFKASDPQLIKVLKQIRNTKEQLLYILKNPKIPLHNNASENDIRELVTKRKISGGTRSDAGRDARDTFTSLFKTCKKLKIRFWNFLDDRLNKTHQIPLLADIVRKKIADSVPSP